MQIRAGGDYVFRTLNSSGLERFRIDEDGDIETVRNINSTGDINSSNVQINSNGIYLLNGNYRVGTTAIVDSSRNLVNIGTISSGAITTIGSTSDNTADTLTAKDSSNATLFRVRNDGVVLISDNYLYVNSSQGAYFDGTVRCRNGINDDSGRLSIDSSTGDISFNNNDLISIDNINSGLITTSAGMVVTDTTNNGRGIYRNNRGYDLRLGGGTDRTTGAYIIISGDQRG